MQPQNTILQNNLVLGRRPFLFKSTLKKSVIGKESKVIDANIAKCGIFKGYRDGEFTLNRRIFDQMISNFQSETSAAPVYRGHADLGLTPKGEEPIAAGWILGLERRGDDLWAKVELTDELAGEIRAGNFKYTSIFCKTENIHRVSGKDIGARLVSLAITNQPFIDGLVELSLSQRNTGEVATYSTKDISKMIDVKQNAKKILSTLALDATEERLAALEAALQEMLPADKALAEDESPAEDAPEDAVAPEVDMERLESLRVMASEILGEELDMSGLLDKVEEMLTAMADAAPVEGDAVATEELAAKANARKVNAPDAVTPVLTTNPAFVALRAELDETRQLLQVLTEEKTTRDNQDNEDAVMMAITEGKILEVTKNHWIKLMAMDKELALSLIGGQTAVNTGRIVKTTGKDTQRTSAKVIALTEHERKILAGAGISNR